MPVIRHADARKSETPGGVMTTLASPTQGGASRALWHVEVKADVSGPLHDFDSEQVWTWLSGTATVELAGEELTVAAGDTVVMPPHTARRVVAGGSGYTAIVTAQAGARASTTDGGDHGVPAWIA
jgi:quercetin dioxygenase-like cupin family protein